MPSNMSTDDFDFELPESLIAQTPLEKRDHSKLMVLNRSNGTIKHKHFYEIIDFLKPGDILVRNNTRVIPARLFGTKEETNAHVEVLLLSQDDQVWECLVGNARVVKIGAIISFGDGRLKAECVGIGKEGIRYLKMIYDGVFLEILDSLGLMPLPPYIKEKLEDKERYQTVYSKVAGSAAAPTAGLHFTNELIQQIEAKGIQIVDVTLHVGLGTFRPVKVDNVLEHDMHSEYYEMSSEVASILNDAKDKHHRIISVGTTTTRVLETIYNEHQSFVSCKGNTKIFIYPGYKFLAIDGLITNFHLPKSTLVMLVSAFSKKEYILNAYKEAIEHQYRFFSFGDSMFITNENELS